MNEISPTYYAAHISVNEKYTLNGERFSLIPSDAIGILASDNDNPLQNRDVVSAGALLQQVSKEDNVMIFEQAGEYTHNSETYMGAILSADRSIVYWVNDTKPLP